MDTKETLRFGVLKENHWQSVERIYREGIDTRIATFEYQTPSWSDWNLKFLPNCRLIASLGDSIVGWAALQGVSDRNVYKGVAEDSVYVDSALRGKGIGKALLERLIDESEKEGFWMLTASIFEENEISIKLHQSLGFKIIGVREGIGKRNGKWVNNVLMDRRSDKIGVS